MAVIHLFRLVYMEDRFFPGRMNGEKNYYSLVARCIPLRFLTSLLTISSILLLVIALELLCP